MSIIALAQIGKQVENLGHIWAPKFSLVWLSWVRPTCQLWKIKCTLVHSKFRKKMSSKFYFYKVTSRDIQKMLKLVLCVLMMIFMINLPISTVFYMKNNFRTKISRNGHCGTADRLKIGKGILKSEPEITKNKNYYYYQKNNYCTICNMNPYARRATE